MSITDIKDWLEDQKLEQGEDVAGESSHKRKKLDKETELDKAKDLAEAKISALFPNYKNMPLNDLPRMLQELYQDPHLNNGIRRLCMDDEAAFVKLLGSLTSDTAGDKNAANYWPLVKCVR